LGVENGVIFGFGGHFGVFLVILGSNPALFSFFVVTSPLRESVRVLAIAPHLLNVSGHRRRLVRRTVERLVQLFHFVRSQRLSPENWCFCVEKGVFFGFGGHFGVFLVIFGRETGTFSHFLA
jgi:hypothetical protein